MATGIAARSGLTVDDQPPGEPTGRQALDARKWFAQNGPPDLQPLPLGYAEREQRKRGGADTILGWYARSLDFCRNYDVLEHPSFNDFARGVMASEFCPDSIKNNETLQRRFPPRPLEGLNNGMVWEESPRARKVRPSKARTA